MRQFAMVGVILVLISGVAQAQDYQRAVRNYQAVISGAKKLDALTAEEQAEVLALARAMSRRTPPGASSQCRDARDRADSARQELEDRARRLMRCAEGSDLHDDCDTEARRARNAQSEFSSAVSSMQSDCG
jgi:hypothetical protein